MKRVYLNSDQIDRQFCKPFVNRTCKELKSNLRYYALVDDFGEVVKKIHYKVKPTGSRIVEVREIIKPDLTEGCLF